MNAADFEKKVLNGDITNFEPYFKKASSHDEGSIILSTTRKD